MAIERRRREGNQETVVMIACPYCDTAIHKQQRGLAQHLPCSETPTNEEIAEAKENE